MRVNKQSLQHVLHSSILGSLLIFCPLSVAAKEPSQSLPVTDLQRFTKVIEYIKEYYVSPVDDDFLFENATRGMLAGLDPHSSYFDVEEFSSLKTSTSGKFGGLGVEIIPEDGYIRIISPIDGTPAAKAGLQAGDLIVRLNDTPVNGLTPKEAIEMMRGEKGSKISLTIIREGETKPLVIDVIRDTISVKSVGARMLDDTHAYVRISQFQNNTGDDLIRAIQKLKKEHPNKLKGLILDLRNNPGGIFDTAPQVADAFLDRSKLKEYDGVIVYTKGRITSSQIKEKAHDGDILEGAPMVVLINSGTASSSEIVSGALQDYKRAIIAGTDSFGKASYQIVFPLKGNRGLKLTTGLYYTPAGRSIQATGIKPDILIPNLHIPSPDSQEDPNRFVIREGHLQGHLKNSDEAKAAEEKQEETKKIAMKEKLLYTDYQLHEALNILKGLTLARAEQGKK